MKYISVNKVLTWGWTTISIIAITAIAIMIILFSLIDKYNWPLYIGIPLAIVLPLTFMIVCFQYAGRKWVAWSYTHVSDVIELEKAAQISGFGAYSVEDIKDERRRALIKERFANYRFEDDLTVPHQTTIYFRKPYRNLFFMIMAGGFILTIIPFFIYPSSSVQAIMPLFFGLAAFFAYYKTSARSPQMTLSDGGIEMKGMFYEWSRLSDIEVTQGKISYLSFTYDGNQIEVALDNLMVGNRRLNHLLHVYENRSKFK